MKEPITLCGGVFTPEMVEHLETVEEEDPSLSNNGLARVLCVQLGWFSADGRPAVSSAKVALRKLRARGLLPGLSRRRRPRPHRLRGSGQPLPAVSGVPRRVDGVRGLHLYLIGGHRDPPHRLWNDLMIGQHPCGDAPPVGSQLRCLIGGEHGWLGAIGFGPTAFVLGARDRWIGWSTAARLGRLREVPGLSRFLIRREVHCAHLASKALGLGEAGLERRAPAFDLIVAWRVLACLKLGRALPQLPARVIYTEDELKVLWGAAEKKPQPPSPGADLGPGQSVGGAIGRLHGPQTRWTTRGPKSGDRLAAPHRYDLGLETVPAVPRENLKRVAEMRIRCRPPATHSTPGTPLPWQRERHQC